MTTKFNCGLVSGEDIIYFSPEEFVCPCCGTERMQAAALKKLDNLRAEFGRSIGIVEGGGYRCAVYDSNEHSAHRSGYAADLNIGREHYYQIVGLAMSKGFRGIGINNRNVDGAVKFQLHIDISPNIPGIRPRPWIWTY